MIHFSRITGIMLVLVFGSQLVFLHLRERGLRYEAELLQREGRLGFARISRTQELSKFSPVIRSRYYLSMEGKIGNRTFYKSERVPPDFYYLYSVGSNVEVVFALLWGKRPILHIRKNPLPYGETPRLLSLISSGLFYFGCALVLFGFLVGPLIGRLFSLAYLQNTKRPHL